MMRYEEAGGFGSIVGGWQVGGKAVTGWCLGWWWSIVAYLGRVEAAVTVKVKVNVETMLRYRIQVFNRANPI